MLAPSWDEALRFVNDYAPEHLEVLSAEPLQHLGGIHNAGEILLGQHTPITIANFCLGPDCVLPTGGWARSWSALGVHDFMKRTSLGHVTASGLPGAGAACARAGRATRASRRMRRRCRSCGRGWAADGDSGQAAGAVASSVSS